MSKKCEGCGVLLQNTSELEPGYVKELKHDYCLRCFKNIHYSEIRNQELAYTNEDLLDKINNNSSLTLFLVDFISLNKEIIETFKKIKTKKVLVINKCDIIPKSIKQEKIMDFIIDEYAILDKIVVISSLKNKNLSQIKNIIEENKNVYITGYTNAGKSSLIKSLMSKYTNNKSKITTSIMPNTTMDFIKINFNDSYFYDTPGFIYKNSLWDKDIKVVKKANGKKEIKPVVLQIKPNDIVSIDNEWFINVDKKNNIVFYMNNTFEIKKVYNKDINYKETINMKSDTDLIIKGIGFINFKESCTIELSIPKNYLEKRNSIFK